MAERSADHRDQETYNRHWCTIGRIAETLVTATSLKCSGFELRLGALVGGAAAFLLLFLLARSGGQPAGSDRMPIVSVIIPAFNAKDTLNETLKSVISQTRLDWEAIIVNDGSTDETLTLAQSWCQRDPRIRLVTRPNKGLAATRNDGAAIASGPWLLFLDADDLIEPKWMNAMLGVAAAKPDAGVIHCGYVKFLPDGRWDDPVVPPDDDYFENLSRQNLFQPNALLVRRELFVELGGFDPAFSACADWDMWLRIARTGARFAGTNEALARYRLSQNQMSRGAEALFWDSCRVIDVAHGRDPRVKRPHPSFAEGAPRQQRGGVILRAAAWCAGVMVGAGADPNAFLGGLEIDDVGDVKVEWITAAIAGAVPHGACLLYEDWPLLWERHRQEIRHLVECLGRLSRKSDFAAACWSDLNMNLPGPSYA